MLNEHGGVDSIITVIVYSRTSVTCNALSSRGCLEGIFRSFFPLSVLLDTALTEEIKV